MDVLNSFESLFESAQRAPRPSRLMSVGAILREQGRAGGHAQGGEVWCAPSYDRAEIAQEAEAVLRAVEPAALQVPRPEFGLVS